MNIAAIIACRNEQPYLGNCLSFLTQNQIKFAIIDNGSTDSSRDIIHRREFRPSLLHYEFVPSDGVFRLAPLLERKMRLAEELDADWVIHHDSDEMMHSYREGESLADAITRISETGANVINLDEFVFLPLDHNYVPDCAAPQPIKYYYFFEPFPNRLNRIWKPRLGLSNVIAGGHRLSEGPAVIAQETLALRHYIFRDQEHARRKYASRTFPPDALARGWHFNRHNQPIDRFEFPPQERLKTLVDPASRRLDRTDPKLRHYWQW